MEFLLISLANDTESTSWSALLELDLSLKHLSHFRHCLYSFQYVSVQPSLNACEVGVRVEGA